MKRVLACLAIALCGGEAVAQLQVQAVTDFQRCKEFMVTNPSDHQHHVNITYHYDGQDSQGRPAVWNWQTSGTIHPRSTATVSKQAVPMIDCNKPYTFSFQWRSEDLTAMREAEQRRIDASREGVIRSILEAEEAKKRQAEEYARKQQAEADERARKAAEQQAARDAAAKRAQQLGQMQTDYQMDGIRQMIAAGDPRCRNLVSPGTTPETLLKDHQTCVRNVTEHDRLAPRSEIAKIDPNTCLFPNVTHYNAVTPADADAAMREAQARVDACRRARDGVQASVTPAYAGPDPAVLQAERLRAEQAETQRLLAMERAETQRRLDMQAAALEAERQAMIRQNAQQSMHQTTADARASNADFARQSQSVAQSNAELEAWLNGN